MVNPALPRFLERLSRPFAVGQVVVRRHPRGFELRHVSDAEAPEEPLQKTSISELRTLAAFTQAGQFRPLKSAPDLRAGWRCIAADEPELERALHHLYPGFLPDWFSTLAGMPPVTHFRPFMTRQMGRYRAVHSLSDAEAAPVVRACCAARFCLKRRLWTVKGLATDAVEEKSAMPCLEPCAILLEFARHATAEVQNASGASLTRSMPSKAPGDAISAPVRTADFSDPRNPRCIQLQIERGK